MFKGIPHYRTGGCRSESWETPRSLISVLPPFNDEGGLGVSIPGDSNSSGEVAPCVNPDHLWGASERSISDFNIVSLGPEAEGILLIWSEMFIVSVGRIFFCLAQGISIFSEFSSCLCCLFT